MGTSRFSHEDVEVTETETVYKGFFRMQQYRLRHRLYGGGWSGSLKRELLVRGNATCVLPYDPVADQVVLCEQFRIGALLHERSPWLLELVAGINEPGESSESVAVREAEEEAGLILLGLEKICDYLTSPGGSSESVELWCGRIQIPASAGIFGLADEGEDIHTRIMGRQQAYEAIAAGRIYNAATIMVLQWLQLNHHRLREQWGPGRPVGTDFA